MDNKGEVIIYQTEDGLTHIDVKLEDETSFCSTWTHSSGSDL